MTTYLSNKISKLSFMAIIMVVFLHAYNIDTKQGGVVLHFEKGYNWFIQHYISNGLTRIAVPLFFLISGFLFFKGKAGRQINFGDKIKKRISSLVVPYFFWVLSGILFYWLLQSFPQSQSFFTKKLIENYSFQDWVNAIFTDLIPYQFWFIRDLIIITLLSPVIYVFVKRLPALLILLVIPFWFLNQNTVFLTSESFLFFSLGAYISVHKPGLPQAKCISPNWYYVFLLWLILVAAKTCVVFVDGPEMVANSLHKLSVLIGLIGFWAVYDKFPQKEKIHPVYSFSFFIYAFHEPFLTIAKKGMFYATRKTEMDYFIIYFAAPLVTIFISIIVALVLKKYVTGFYSVITGNR